MQEWMKTEKETPQQEQERLLHQVKADNQEMGSVEKRYVYFFKCYRVHTGSSTLYILFKGETGTSRLGMCRLFLKLWKPVNSWVMQPKDDVTCYCEDR